MELKFEDIYATKSDKKTINRTNVELKCIIYPVKERRKRSYQSYQCGIEIHFLQQVNRLQSRYQSYQCGIEIGLCAGIFFNMETINRTNVELKFVFFALLIFHNNLSIVPMWN